MKMKALRLVRGAAGKSILHHPAHNSLRQLLCFCHYFLHLHLHLHLPLPLSLGLLVFPPLEMNKVVFGDSWAHLRFWTGFVWGFLLTGKALAMSSPYDYRRIPWAGM